MLLWCKTSFKGNTFPNTYKHEIIHKKGFLKHISRPPWLAQPQYLHCSTTAKHTIGDKIIRAEEVNDFDGRTAAVVDGRSVARCKKLTSIGKGHLQCWTTKNPLIWRKFNLTFTSHLKSNNEYLYHVAEASCRFRRPIPCILHFALIKISLEISFSKITLILYCRPLPPSKYCSTYGWFM